MKKDATVAIIGGGISGLSVAYELVHDRRFEGSIKIFEKSPTLGGNADTAEVILGYDHRTGKEFKRFADMGVNDINLGSYDRTREAMKTIHYLKDLHLRPLEDSVCFFSPDNREIWTKDLYLIEDQPGVVDMRFSLNADANKDLRVAEANFMSDAADDYDPVKKDPAFWGLTVDQYVEEYRSRDTIEDGLLDQLVRLFLKPRIAAMYFANDTGPGGMPMRGVMSYYRLQEGYEASGEATEADRRYFVKGSQDWINALAEYLQEDDRVEIELKYEAKVEGDGAGRVRIHRRSEDSTFKLSEQEDFDVVVMAAHADHQLASFMPSADPLLTSEMVEYLSRIEYSDSISIAHTFAGVLPANVDSWRTYNVMIRDDHVQTPYQMTYVQNRHQNDRMSENYNVYGLPIYFVSLNPEINIPDRFVLRTDDAERQRRLDASPGYMPAKVREAVDAGKAVSYFRHTVMTEFLLEVQDNLPRLQGMADGRVYFAGCWAIGAGLHEECFMQAEKVLDAMFGDPT